MNEFDSFILEVEGIFKKNLGSISRVDFRQIIRRYNGARFYICKRHTRKQDAIDFAISKLQAGQPRSEIANRIASLFECSKVTAYKCINQALIKL